jgi:MFS family permease
MGALLKLPRAVHVLCLGGFLVSAGMMVIPFLALYLSKHLGLGDDFATMAFGAHGIGQIFGTTVGGVLGDRYGRRSTMIGSLGLAAILALVLIKVTTPTGILLVMPCFSAAVAAYRPASQAMLSDLVSGEERPTAYSLMYAAGNLGFAVATGAGGLIAKYSYEGLFVADALASIVYASIILLFVKETRPSEAEAAAQVSVGALEAYVRMAKDRTFMIFCLAAVAVSLVYTQALSTLPLTMEHASLGVEDYGQVMMLNGLLIMVLQVPVTSMFARLNRASMIAFGDVLVAIGFGVTALCVTKGHFAGSVMLWTLGEIVHAAFRFSMVGDLAPVELRARYFGVFGGVWAVSNSIGPPIGGLLLTHSGPAPLFGACAVLAMIACALNASLRGAFARTPQPVMASATPVEGALKID